MTLSDSLVLACILALVGFSSCYACDPPVEAQIPARLAAGGVASSVSDEAASVTLARALIAESDGHEADWRGMLAVFQARADRVHSTPDRVARRYCSIYRVRPRPLTPLEVRTVRSMGGGNSKLGMLPQHARDLYNRARQLELQALPEVLPESRRDQWTRAADLTQRWLAGDHAHGCSETPTHFGGPRADRARALRMRWVVVTCPGSLSGFWRERGRR